MYGVKVIKAKKKATPDSRQIIRNALMRVGRATVKEYDNLTETWNDPPTFKIATHVTASDSEVVVMVSPDPDAEATKVYGYVNNGTKAHDIWAGYYTGKSKHKVLAFPSQFTPKTKPGSLTSGSGSSGGPTVFTPFVRHPGTKARGFDKAMSKKMAKKFRAEMIKALKEIANKGYKA